MIVRCDSLDKIINHADIDVFCSDVVLGDEFVESTHDSLGCVVVNKIHQYLLEVLHLTIILDCDTTSIVCSLETSVAHSLATYTIITTVTVVRVSVTYITHYNIIELIVAVVIHLLPFC
jgi:hypothetical protein